MTYAELLEELEGEAPATRRHLERLPADKLAWKPAEKSLTLGQLALHIADSIGGTAEMAVMDKVDMPDFGFPQPASVEEVLSAYDASIAKARQILSSADESNIGGTVEFMSGGQVAFAMPRKQFLRSVTMNHTYHHRGQLTVYLRELGVPLASTYGPTADEAMGM